MSERLYFCRRCGMVRASDRAPWCRHYALDLPAARMVDVPLHHPYFGEPVELHRDMPLKQALVERRAAA